MSYMRVHGYDAGRILAAANPGDVVSLGEIGTIINNAAAQTLAAAALAGQVIIRQGAGVVNDVTDTAVNIIQALYGNTGSEPRVGEGFLCWYSIGVHQLLLSLAALVLLLLATQQLLH
jgi:hypothetical protein